MVPLGKDEDRIAQNNFPNCHGSWLEGNIWQMAIVDVAYIVATGNSTGLRERGKGTNRNSSDGRNQG